MPASNSIPCDAYVQHCRETVRPMLCRWSDWMVMGCVAAAFIFVAIAVTSVFVGYPGGSAVAVSGFLSAGCLTLFALTWRFFSIAAIQMLQLLETAVAPTDEDIT